MSAGLVLDLRLDELSGPPEKRVFHDSSATKRVAPVDGNVEVVPDDLFGACAAFDGQDKDYTDNSAIPALSIPSDPALKFVDDLTIGAWVYVSGPSSLDVSIVRKGTWPVLPGAPFALGFELSFSPIFRTWTLQRAYGNGELGFSKICQCTHPSQLDFRNRWYRITGVFCQSDTSGPDRIIYIHDATGKLVAKSPPARDPVYTVGRAEDGTSDDPVTVGLGRAPARMAHLRIHNRALSEREIEQAVFHDLGLMAPFRQSYPIDFRLDDNDGDEALYISEDERYARLTLKLTNSSSMNIVLGELNKSGRPTKDEFHFALRFRPGTLSPRTIDALITNPTHVLSEESRDGWGLGCSATARTANNDIMLFLYHNGNNRNWAPGEVLAVTLRNFTAEPGAGSRGSRIELVPGRLRFEVDGATPITGIRSQYLQIINRRGLKTIPLHVWFSGGGTILNDGSPQRLSLRIGNSSTEQDLTLGVKSKFHLSFDVGGSANAEWTLTNQNAANNVTMKCGVSGPFLYKQGGGETISSSWELGFNQPQTLGRRGGNAPDPLEIEIENICVEPQPEGGGAGHANLYVRYENIPGYQDGQFILTIEKGPLVFSREAGSLSNVGIGTSAPNAKLSVVAAGDDKHPVLSVGKGKAEFLRVDNDGTVHVLTALNVPTKSFDVTTSPGVVISERWYDASQYRPRTSVDMPDQSGLVRVGGFIDFLGMVHLHGELRATIRDWGIHVGYSPSELFGGELICLPSGYRPNFKDNFGYGGYAYRTLLTVIMTLYPRIGPHRCTTAYAAIDGDGKLTIVDHQDFPDDGRYSEIGIVLDGITYKVGG